MILLVIFLGFIGFLILGIFYDVAFFFFLEAKSYLSPYFFDEKHVRFLEKNFSYYQKLPQKSRKIFTSKVARFMSSKEFIPDRCKLLLMK